MKEVLQSSPDDGDGRGDCKGHVDGDEDARIEGETNPLFVSETTCGITHLFRNVSASPHAVGLLPVGISPSPLFIFFHSILFSFLLEISCIHVCIMTFVHVFSLHQSNLGSFVLLLLLPDF